MIDVPMQDAPRRKPTLLCIDTQSMRVRRYADGKITHEAQIVEQPKAISAGLEVFRQYPVPSLYMESGT